ncbi:hypothetical protein [Zavarzinella formosa]|uniref:hypothetical protein n=1 Tax=Zavarzinella formosa TaxID=360055 RepID=UPI0002EDACDC|nr:hypothetical protein [Zavarzinella formosa]
MGCAFRYLLVCGLAAVPLMARAQLPTEGRTSYSKDDRIRIPFELRSGGSASSVRLYYTIDGGAWQEYETAKAGQKREFVFKVEREGTYGFATMTTFNDGTTDPSSRDRLTEQRRVVIDRTPPKVTSLRPVIAADGSPGIEWDVSDENMDTRNGIRLEFRWPDMGRFEPIDKGVPFAPRDHRQWQMKPNDRMQVRIVALDKAGNKTESDPVWVSAKDGEKGGDPIRDPLPTNRLTTDPKDLRENPAGSPAPGLRTLQPSVHYVKEKSITLNFNARVGQSGLTHAYLYAADDKLDWLKAKEEGPKPAPPVASPDAVRTIPLSFVYEAQKDGTYNFIIIAENHRGPSRRIPVKGTLGDIQVVVDTKAPDVEIISTKVSPNGDRGAVVDIRWKASDINIAPVPVMLEYRPADKQEWKGITADWTDNTGQHTWTAPTGESHEFHIRVRCRDRAGNIGEKMTDKPVNVDLAVPQVDYQDVVPGGSGISVGPGPGGPKR